MQFNERVIDSDIFFWFVFINKHFNVLVLCTKCWNYSSYITEPCVLQRSPHVIFFTETILYVRYFDVENTYSHYVIRINKHSFSGAKIYNDVFSVSSF